MKRGRPAETLAIPRNSWSADAAVKARPVIVCTLEPKTPRLPPGVVVSRCDLRPEERGRSESRAGWWCPTGILDHRNVACGSPAASLCSTFTPMLAPGDAPATHKPLHR